MTFLEIEAFLKIAQCGSFSAAAEKLYITQPALGRRIRALEEELGYSLFIRNKGVRHVELTRQGRAFVGIAHRWQALWNETQEESLLGNEKSFYVASVGSLLAFMLPTVFQEFMKDTPECSLHVTTLHSSDAYGYVNNKTVDIAFITDPMYSSQVKTEILFKEKLCLVVGTELKLPDSGSVFQTSIRARRSGRSGIRILTAGTTTISVVRPSRVSISMKWAFYSTLRRMVTTGRFYLCRLQRAS